MHISHLELANTGSIDEDNTLNSHYVHLKICQYASHLQLNHTAYLMQCKEKGSACGSSLLEFSGNNIKNTVRNMKHVPESPIPSVGLYTSYKQALRATAQNIIFFRLF